MEELKSAVVCLSVDPSIGGLLLLGSKGTGKSTIVRAFAELLPEVGRFRQPRTGAPGGIRSRKSETAFLEGLNPK